MCIFGNTPALAAAPPPESAQARQPDAAAVRSSAGRRTTDKLRSGTKTILTGASGVSDFAPTEKKTLLGQ